MSLGVWVVDVGLPTGGVKYAGSSFNSATGGTYTDRIPNGGWGMIRRQPSDRSGGMAASETSFDIADVDRAFARVVEGALRESVEGSTVVIKHADPSLVSSSWYTAFTGVVAKWNWPSEMRARIVARVDDLSLRRKVPRSTWILGAPDWPRIHPDAVGKYANIVYGIQDSQGYSATGMVDCHYVDTTLFQYVVAAGPINIGRVYADGAPVTFGTKIEIRGGKTFTTAVLGTSAGDAKVTADVSGYDTTTPGGGTITSNPATQIAHMLTNFSFGDWKTGAWLSTTARIDATYLSAMQSYFTQHGHRGGGLLTGPADGYSHIRDWNQTFECKSWWNGEGKIAWQVEDPTDTGIYLSSPRILNEAGFAFTYDDQALVTDLVANYNFQPVTGRYMSSVNPSSPKKYAEAPDVLNFKWWSVE